ncbi:MAG: HAD family hydrolase [Bdellovibrionota bacterium]
MIKLLIFDLDGTIIDSEVASFQAILDCTQKWGVPVSKEEAAVVVGQKWEVAFDLLFSQHKMPVSREEASKAIIDRFKEIVREELGVVPGVVDAIRNFAGAFRLALVSGSHREDVLWALTKLGVQQHFELIYGAEDYERSKPAPDGYLKALKTLGVAPNEALIFEDSVAGLASAEASGVRSVAITCTNHFGHDQSKAHLHIDNFHGVDAAWVKKNFS